MKNIHRVSIKQYGLKSGVFLVRNSTITQDLCAGAASCSNIWKSNYPHRHVNVIALHVFLWLQL